MSLHVILTSFEELKARPWKEASVVWASAEAFPGGSPTIDVREDQWPRLMVPANEPEPLNVA
jgi:hypothetical protein